MLQKKVAFHEIKQIVLLILQLNSAELSVNQKFDKTISVLNEILQKFVNH